MAAPRRILVIRPDRIGDVVLSTPTIRALRHRYPDAYIAAMVRPATEPVLRHNPRLDAILLDDWESTDAGREGFRRVLRMVRRHRFDTALMLLPTERHAWMTFLAGIPRRIGVGTRLYQVLTFARGISRNKHSERRHEADYCLDLARAVGANSDDLSTEIFLENGERDDALDRLRELGLRPEQKLVVVSPASGRSAPNWDPEEYVALTATLLDTHPDVSVFASVPPGDPMLPQFEALRNPRLLLHPDGDLRRLIGIISHAMALVSASTGPMHIAAGLGIPTVSLFCPLPPCEPALWRPLGNDATTLLPPSEYCALQCPGDPHVCTLHGGISPSDVLHALTRFLS